MAYGQIKTSSGRTLNLTPDRGWVNDDGEQLVPNMRQFSLADLAGRPGGMQAMPDYAQPIEVGGVGKGYRAKGDPRSVVLQDGRTIQLGVDRDAMMRREKEALDMEGKRLGNELTLAQIAAAGRREAPTYQHIETSDGMYLFNPRTGEARPMVGEDGQRMGGGKALTEFQGKSTGFGMRAENASRIIDEVGKGGEVQPSLIKQAAESVPLIGGALGMVANNFASPEQQRVEQAQRDFVNAVLRQESGAAIGADEFNNARKQYFPAPGDSPDVVAQKRTNRELAINGFRISAGPGAKQFGQAAPARQSGAVAQAINEAKAAIAAGANRDAVIKRLQQLGINDFGGV